MKILSGWANYPKILANEVCPNNEEELIELINSSQKKFIARGNGRAYGDASINEDLTINMRNMNRILKWDSVNGELIAETGLLLSEVIDAYLPMGWFPFVTPGTKYITLGGAIAADIHGKNHHTEGSFGNFVNWIELIDGEGKIHRCSSRENEDLYGWTLGGMGLTGVISRCSIQLKPVESGWIKQKIVINKNLEDTLKAFDEFKDSNYSVAWIDCLSKGKNLGRSVLMLGEHALHDEIKKKKNFPLKRKRVLSVFTGLFSIFLNNTTVRIFNSLFYTFNSILPNTSLVTWDKFFYPLDSIKKWNNLYGKEGFFQFQCVLPLEVSEKTYRKILEVIQSQSDGSFLGVFKKFGRGNGYLSFPREGFTLSLDFKLNNKNLKVASTLFDLIRQSNGTIYLAKDSLLKDYNYRSMINETKLKEFMRYRSSGLESVLSKRLKI